MPARPPFGLLALTCAVGALRTPVAPTQQRKAVAVDAAPSDPVVVHLPPEVKPQRSFIPGLGNLLRARRRADPAPPVAAPCISQVCLQPAAPEEIDAGSAAKGTQTLSLRLGDEAFTVLTGMTGQLVATSTAAGDGAFLSLNADRRRSLHNLQLGTLSCERFLAGARIKRWWMGPAHGARGGEMPPETQLALLQLGPNAYAVILPLVEDSMRATLRGAGEDQLVAQVQSGCRDVKTHTMDSALYVGVGASPYKLLHTAFGAVSERLGTFEVVSKKQVPADLDVFGWCTWDAFYQSVSPKGVREGVASLHEGGTPPRFLVLDDGWQTVRHDDGSGVVKEIVADADLAAAKNEPSQCASQREPGSTDQSRAQPRPTAPTAPSRHHRPHCAHRPYRPHRRAGGGEAHRPALGAPACPRRTGLPLTHRAYTFGATAVAGTPTSTPGRRRRWASGTGPTLRAHRTTRLRCARGDS